MGVQLFIGMTTCMQRMKRTIQGTFKKKRLRGFGQGHIVRMTEMETEVSIGSVKLHSLGSMP